MGKLFGTDGIRGKANSYPMTAETALALGRALALLKEITGYSGDGMPFVIIGKDTRISGDMLVSAVAAGAASAGIDVYLTGVIPTPGVALLTRKMSALAGVVISASHNPYEDNGIKLFKHDGHKLSAAMEQDLEQAMLSSDPQTPDTPYHGVGSIHDLPDAADQYREFLISAAGYSDSPLDIRAVIDCSHGAASFIIPEIFGNEPAFQVIHHSPDGTNINRGCGSEHPLELAATVKNGNAQVGLAFDGDADRLIAVDEKGRIVSGDQLIAIFADHLSSCDTLKNNIVVTTVMSNVGLTEFLTGRGITHIKADVGDRNVVNDMIAHDAVLGGEDSGHLVLKSLHTTGDGILSALMLLTIMKKTGRPLSELASIMTVYPQVLENVAVKEKPPIHTIPEIRDVIGAVEGELGSKGRVLVRYSGTQSMCRVMVEGPSKVRTEQACRRIADVIQRILGG